MVNPGDPGVSLCHSQSCREVDGETPPIGLGGCDKGGEREEVRSAWGSEVREPGEGKCQNRSAKPSCRASCTGPGPDGYERLRAGTAGQSGLGQGQGCPPGWGTGMAQGWAWRQTFQTADSESGDIGNMERGSWRRS